ncbi:MAG: hypothetical protein KA712_15400 [Myxococcales bacterium]|nr:hypothetical protein [Myxococcales bacterium]
MTIRSESRPRRMSRRLWLGAGALCLGAGLAPWAAAAEPGEETDDPQGDEAAPANEPGGYIGVAPGSTNRNPLPKPDANPPKLVWTGFQPGAAGAKVFLQTTSAVTYELKANGTALSLLLRNCRIFLKNNERDLNTRFFDSPVAGIKARQRRKDIEVTIALKAPATTSPRVEEGPDGTQFVVLEFPAVVATK